MSLPRRRESRVMLKKIPAFAGMTEQETGMMEDEIEIII